MVLAGHRDLDWHESGVGGGGWVVMQLIFQNVYITKAQINITQAPFFLVRTILLDCACCECVFKFVKVAIETFKWQDQRPNLDAFY